MIELININKTYEDGFRALKDINLKFEDGKINVLIGPSGCGKTTTLKLLNRLVDYSDGEILIDDQNIYQLNTIELRRQMGFVIQNIGLFPHMSIYNNVASVPKLLKWDKEKIQNRVTELLKLVSLDPDTYMDRKPSELSGGQQQRIGVIRALAADPSTILMDEPFSALDPISREQIQDELIHLQKEINKTIVFVTHDMDEAIKIADNIILMKDGEVVQQGSPTDLLRNPANDFVRDFIGEKRLLGTAPQLSEFISENPLVMPNTSSTESVIEQMVFHKVENVMVTNDDSSYLGQVNLYNALANKDKSLQDLLDGNTKPIYENSDIRNVMNEIGNTEDDIPIINKSKKLIGVLDINKLFQALRNTIDSKSGDV